jgi:hypothetical protein
MPKKRQIPFFFPQRLADRTIVWHWKPSARLRKAGFVNVKLGSEESAAVLRALELNAQVRAWESDGPAALGREGVALTRAAPRIVRFDELVRRYRASPAFTALRKSTRHEYATRLNQLETWAIDGTLAVRDIDKMMVRDLRTALVEGSPYKAAATLRVLRLLLNWAVDESIIRDNPAMSCKIPEPPRRKTITLDGVREAIRAAAIAKNMLDVELCCDLGFWALQRQGDLLTLNRLAWRELDTVDPRYAAVLANARGRVMAFRLQQSKTGTWVDAPLPPFLHDRVEAAMAQSPTGWVFHHPDRPAEAMPGWMLQRRFREARDAAIETATAAEDAALVDQLTACQFRDLRRTGMSFYSNMGALVPWITALSGHSVTGHKTILDTYMPGNTEGAVACVATGLIGMAARAKREKQA